MNFLQSLSASHTLLKCKQSQVTFAGKHQFPHKVTAQTAGWGFVGETNTEVFSHTHILKNKINTKAPYKNKSSRNDLK